MKLSEVLRDRVGPFAKTLNISGDEVISCKSVLKVFKPISDTELKILLSLVKRNIVTAVLGNRQSGKTWLLQNIVGAELRAMKTVKVLYVCSSENGKRTARDGMIRELGRFIYKRTDSIIYFHDGISHVHFVTNEIESRGKSHYDYVMFDDIYSYDFYNDLTTMHSFSLTLFNKGAKEMTGHIVVCTSDIVNYDTFIRRLNKTNVNFQEVRLYGSQDGRNL